MHQRLIMLGLLVILLVGILPTVAQEPTVEPFYDPACAFNLTEAFISGWQYNHRQGGNVDTVQAANVASTVYKVLQPLKLNCTYPTDYVMQNVLRSMHGDYAPEDIARLIKYLQETVGLVDANECAYNVANQFTNRVDWGDSTTVQIGRVVAEIYRSIRAVSTGECDAEMKFVASILSQLYDIPPDGTIVSTLYRSMSNLGGGQPVSEYACGYQLADTFFESVDWEGLSADEITDLVRRTFAITYGISGTKACEDEPALAITAMLMNDVYEFPPDPTIIQKTYFAAYAALISKPEVTPTPIVN